MAAVAVLKQARHVFWSSSSRRGVESKSCMLRKDTPPVLRKYRRPSEFKSAQDARLRQVHEGNASVLNLSIQLSGAIPCDLASLGGKATKSLFEGSIH